MDRNKSSNNISSCCCGCAEQFVKLVNLCISTAYSNRFLQEITGKDEAMQHVSNLLGSISVALHFLAAELSDHILNVEPHLNHFKIFDPKYPSWKGDPTKFVLEGNKVLVVAIEHFLNLLKIHDHHVERSLVKKLIRRTKLIFLWDELEKLLLTEIEKESVDLSRSQIDVKENPESSEEKIKNEDDSTRAAQSKSPRDEIKTEPLNHSKEVQEDRQKGNSEVDPSQASKQIQETIKERNKMKDSANQASEEDILKDLNFSFLRESDESFEPKVTSSSIKEPRVDREHSSSGEDNNVPLEEEQIKESEDTSSLSASEGQVSEDSDSLPKDSSPKEGDVLSDNSIESFEPKVTSSSIKEPKVDREHSSSSENEEEQIKESNESTSASEGQISQESDSPSKDSSPKEGDELSDNSMEYNVEQKTVTGDDLKGTVFFLVLDVPIQSNTLAITDAEVGTFLLAANWIFAYGGTIKVPKKYLDYKFLKDLKKHDKLSAWNGAPWELADEIDLIISVGAPGNFDNSSLEFGKEIPPVIKFDVRDEDDLVDNPLEPWKLKRRISERTMELRRMRLGLRLETLGELTVIRTAMNEVTLMKLSPPNTLRLRVEVDQVLLDEFEADGLIIASPTGSNRSNKKFGGPVASPGLECIIITPVAMRRMTPFIVSPRSRITVSLKEGSHSAYVEFDGNYVGTLDKDGRLVVRAADFFLEELVDKKDSEIKMLSSMKNQ